MTCETARELLPELSAGGLDVGLESALERHLERCASCAAEKEVVALVRATAVFALLTGGLLLRDYAGDDADVEPGLAEVTLGWPLVQDPILRAAPALHDLSVEELESLLAELES